MIDLTTCTGDSDIMCIIFWFVLHAPVVESRVSSVEKVINGFTNYIIWQITTRVYGMFIPSTVLVLVPHGRSRDYRMLGCKRDDIGEIGL